MDNGKDPASASDKRGAAVSPTEPVPPTMRQSGTFEAFGNAGQRLYVRSDRLATEIQSDFGTATYWSTMKPRGNTRSLPRPPVRGTRRRTPAPAPCARPPQPQRQAGGAGRSLGTPPREGPRHQVAAREREEDVEKLDPKLEVVDVLERREDDVLHDHLDVLDVHLEAEAVGLVPP